MGEIVKCPKCGKGHMKINRLSVTGNRRLMKIACACAADGSYYKNGININRRFCSRCGYVEGVDGT